VATTSAHAAVLGIKIPEAVVCVQRMEGRRDLGAAERRIAVGTAVTRKFNEQVRLNVPVP